MSIETEGELAYYKRKAHQAYDMAGLARVDGDKPDAERRLKEAKEWDAKIREVHAREANKG